MVFISIILYKYIKETGDTRGFSFTATGIMLVPVAVTFKQVLLTYLPGYQISVFAIGNLLLFLSYLMIVMGIARTIKRFPTAPWRVWVYISFNLLLISIALFKKEFFIALDLLIYLFVISAVMYAIEISFTLLKIKRNLIRKAIIIFSISLITDFVLKSFTEIWQIPNLNVMKMIAFSIRLIASFVLLLAADKIYSVKTYEDGSLLPEIRTAVQNFLRRFTMAIVIFSVAFSLYTFTSLYVFKFTLKADLYRYTQKISLDASKTARNMQFIFSSTRKSLRKFATDPNIINIDDKGEEELKEYYLEHKQEFGYVSRMDKNGILVYVYPKIVNEGKNISSEPHIREILKTYSVVLSDPFLYFKNLPGVSLHVPVFNEGVFDGSVSSLFDLGRLGNSVIDCSGKNEHVFIGDSHGTIIASRDKNLLLKKVSSIIDEKSVKDGTFVKCKCGYGLLVKKTFTPVSSKIYTVFAFVPKSDVFANLIYRVLILGLLGVAFVISLLYAIRMLYFAYEEETERLKRLAETKTEETQTLSKKLQALVSVFSEIDINKDLTETARQLLNAMMRLIRRGNAGSVIIKDGKNFVFTAVDGYPKFVEGKTLTENEIMPSVKDKPFVIKRIYDLAEKTLKENLRPESRKLFKEIGTSRIKSTIEAPLIVDGEYYGGIFIDNFEDENAFSDDDLKIAESVSKLASLVIKSKLLINSLKDTEDKLFSVMENFSKLDISASEEEFFGKILSIGKKLIPQADAGSATLKTGESYKYVAAFGYGDILKKLRLRADVSYNVQTRAAMIVRDIAKFNAKHLTAEELDILRKAGAFKIKQSVVAPIIVNGEYLGGIFLDSFESEENVFTDKEIKVVSALSKLASIFVGARIAYQKLKIVNNFNESSLKLFHEANIKGTMENVLEVAYDALSFIYGSALQEVAVWGKYGNEAVLIKFDGKRVYRIPISPESFEIATSGKKSLFIEKGDDIHPFAQAVIYSDVSNMPVFRMRFSKSKSFSREEKEFVERFGREVINLYQASEYYSQFKNTLANYILSVGNAISAYDPYTEGHSLRVGFLSLHIARKLGLNQKEMGMLLFAAILHDVGKIGIPQEILLKPGKLGPDEMAVIRRHPAEGEKIVKPINPEAAKIIRHHHENWDGTGYPDGLKGEQIPLLSRIITVADVFDALTTNRPYRKAFDFKKAMDIMHRDKGKMFDPEIFEAFLTIKTEILLKKELDEEEIEEMRKIIEEIY